MAWILRIIEVLGAVMALVYLLMNLWGMVRAWKQRKQTWLPVLLLVLLPVISEAACDTTTVQNQITAASSGDTVTVTPASCTATWNSNVSIPSTKGITLDFNGATITCGTPCTTNNTPVFTVATNATVATRITNFTFTTTNGSNILEVFMRLNTSNGGGDQRYRIDHCTFDGDNMAFHLNVTGAGYGVIDHCTFAWTGNNEVIQHTAYGSGSEVGWRTTVTPGSLDAMYVEDSTFTNRQSGGYLGGKTLSAYGANIVYRFNTLNCMVIDVHGTAGSVGGRWWELYHNVSNAQPNCDNIDKHYQIRAGTGMIFNNTYGTGTNNGAGNIILWEENTGTYPLLYQIGRGKCSADPCTEGGSSNMALDPAYLWGNEDPPMNIGIDEVTGGTIVEDRDFYTDTGGGVGVGTTLPGTCAVGDGYWKTDEGEWWAANSGADGRLYKCTSTNTWTLYYTPATYPHTLQGGGGGGGGPRILMFIEIVGILVSVSWHFRTQLLANAVGMYGLCHVLRMAIAQRRYQAATFMATKYLESRRK